MPRVVHFEMPADDLQRASRFYQDVFGWQMQPWGAEGEYILVSTGKEGPGIDGGITQRIPDRSGTINTIDVSSVDEYVEKIVAHGGTVVAPKMAIPQVGYAAYCRDTEGNLFGLMQEDQSAA